MNAPHVQSAIIMEDRMTITTAVSRSRQAMRSIAAVLAGFMSVAVLSLATDQLLHVLEIYPPWGEPMYDAGLNLLALSYRVVYTMFGGYLTAQLAPYSPMRMCGALSHCLLAASVAPSWRSALPFGPAHIRRLSHSVSLRQAGGALASRR
jgi:hypothetical protein